MYVKKAWHIIAHNFKKYISRLSKFLEEIKKTDTLFDIDSKVVV